MPSIEELERIAIRMVLVDSWGAFRAHGADRNTVCKAVASRIAEFIAPIRQEMVPEPAKPKRVVKAGTPVGIVDNESGSEGGK